MDPVIHDSYLSYQLYHLESLASGLQDVGFSSFAHGGISEF